MIGSALTRTDLRRQKVQIISPRVFVNRNEIRTQNLHDMRIGLTADPELPVPPTLYGGIECKVDMLARSLAARGNEVTLFANAASICPVRRFGWLGRQERLACRHGPQRRRADASRDECRLPKNSQAAKRYLAVV